MTPIRLVELFAGIGAQAIALDRAGIPYVSLGFSEIDKYAISVYHALHGDAPELGDITKIEHLPENIDLLTISSPCTSLSLSGKMDGMQEGSGTASSLIWDAIRLIRDCNIRNDLPKVIVFENVKQIANRKNIKDLDKLIQELNEMNYTCDYKVLNASDYNVPQSRERFFMVCRLDKTHTAFPAPIPLTTKLRDYLEIDVDKRFYLTPERIATLEEHKARNKAKGNGFGYSTVDPNSVCRTLTTKQREEHDTLILVGVLADDGRHEIIRRVYSPEGCCPTLNTCNGGDRQPKIAEGAIYDENNNLLRNIKIRRLTPREFWRCMDFFDKDGNELYDIASKAVIDKKPVSMSRMYMLAGNSICIEPMKLLFESIYEV